MIVKITKRSLDAIAPTGRAIIAYDSELKGSPERCQIQLTFCGLFTKNQKFCPILVTMSENRIAPRKRVLKAGEIEFGGGAID